MGENNWLCPPIALIPRVLRHAQACSAKGTLVVPVWPSAAFWPLLCHSHAKGPFAPFIKDARELPQVATLFFPGLSVSVLFNGRMPNTRVLALRYDFEKHRSSHGCLLFSLLPALLL